MAESRMSAFGLLRGKADADLGRRSRMPLGARNRPLTTRGHHRGMQIQANSTPERLGPARSKPRDKHMLFVVEYVDGRHHFLRVPARVAAFGAGPLVMRFAGEEQLRGHLEPGDIARLVGVR